MPRVTFSNENKVTTTSDYPLLKLKVNEKKRVVVIEKDPYMEFVHTLRAVQVDDRGNVVTEPKRTRDGGTIDVPKMTFVGRPRCLGDFNYLMEHGKHPDRCPVCKSAQETDAVSDPERRFAVHAAAYGTQPGSFELRDPFTLEIVAWVFGNSVYNKLVDFQNEWGVLHSHDLLLGPCQPPENFQKFDIAIAAKAAWMESEQRQAMLKESLKNNACKDLPTLIARSVDRAYVEEDLGKVLLAYQRAYGGGSAVEEPAAVVDAQVDLTGLLDEPPAPAPAAPTAPTPPATDPTPQPDPTPAPAADPVPDLTDMFANTDSPAPTTEAPAPVSEPAPVAAAPAPAADKPMDFDELLNSL